MRGLHRQVALQVCECALFLSPASRAWEFNDAFVALIVAIVINRQSEWSETRRRHIISRLFNIGL